MLCVFKLEKMLRDSDQGVHVCYLDGWREEKGGQGLIEASKTQTGGREIFQALIAVTTYYHT